MIANESKSYCLSAEAINSLAHCIWNHRAISLAIDNPIIWTGEKLLPNCSPPRLSLYTFSCKGCASLPCHQQKLPFFLLSLVPAVGFSNAVKNSLQGLIRYKLKLNQAEAPNVCQWKICLMLERRGLNTYTAQQILRQILVLQRCPDTSWHSCSSQT